MTRTASRTTGVFVRHVRLEQGADTGRYPFTLPVVADLARRGGLDLSAPVMFLVGENGTGKSTLVVDAAGRRRRSGASRVQALGHGLYR